MGVFVFERWYVKVFQHLSIHALIMLVYAGLVKNIDLVKFFTYIHIAANLLDENSTRAVFKKHRPTHVIHLAAMVKFFKHLSIHVLFLDSFLQIYSY